MLGKSVVITSVFAGFGAMFATHVRSMLVDSALIVRHQKIAPVVDHDIPVFSVYIK